jgi:N-acyl-D-amino-acid deacylase
MIITNGRIVDGIGTPWFRGDIRISDGKIDAMERRLERRAEELIDANGKYIAPGFIDVHAHVDGMALLHPEMEGYLFQGITTTSLGNCGYSPFPDKETYVDNMLRICPYGSGIFYANEVKEFSRNWYSLSEYSRIIMENGVAINVAPFIGHISIGWKIGLREPRKATSTEIGKITALVKKGMEEGARGLSVGISYPPDQVADFDEFIDPLRIVGEHDGILAIHIRDFASVQAVQEVVELGKKVQVPIHIVHLNPMPTRFGRMSEILGAIERGRNEGVELTFNVIQSPEFPLRADAWKEYCYFICTFPMLSKEAPLPPKGIQNYQMFEERLKDSGFREDIKRAVIKHIGDVADYDADYFTTIDAVYLIRTGSDEIEGKTIGELADKKGLKPIDLFFDIVFGVSDLAAKAFNPILVSSFFGKREETIKASNHPLGMPCIDLFTNLTNNSTIMAAPFPQGYSAFPTFFRNAIDSGHSIEAAVRKMTSLPAQVLGLKDRGHLKAGNKADIVIFDPDKYKPTADCYNPVSRAEGVLCVLVNGAVALREGKLTGSRSGEVLLKADRK